MRNLLFIFLSTCVFTTFGQYYSYPFKVQIGVGGASYFGDLCEDINCSSWNYNVSLNTRSVFSEHFSVYTHLNFSRLGSDDKENTVRNLSFRSDNIGFGVGTYYSFTKYYVQSAHDKVNPYIGTGIGGLFFNPKAMYQNQWHELQGLTTEGKNYSRFTWQIPIHAGINFRLTDWVAMGVEYSYYIIFTDYLDDISGQYVDNQTLLGVSADLADRTFEGKNIPTNTLDNEHWKAGTQRGNAKKRDAYHTISVYLEIDIIRKNVVLSHP